MEAAADTVLEHELQREISNIMIRDYVRGLHREFEMKLWEHQNCISTLNRNWTEKVSEIAVLRDELQSILSVIVGSEPGVHPHQSHCSLEDQTVVKMKDDSETPVTEKASESIEVLLDIPDFSLLKHMGSEQIAHFVKLEWLKLRRQHESELHEKTEELFRVKREYAKEKASLPLKRERELESIKSKLLHTISKLGEIASSRKEISRFDCSENGEMCRLKDRISMLLHENHRLRGLLAEKREEVKHLSLQVSDAKSKTAQHSLSEEKMLSNFDKLRAELEDLKIERHLNSLLDSSVFREVFDNYENQIHDMDQEGSFLKELLNEKEDQLSIIYEDRQKLKYENNQLVSIAGSIMQHHDQVNLVNDEIVMFKEKVCEQELLILESKGEYNSMKRSLHEAMQQIQVCKHEILWLTENLTSMSIALDEAKEKNASLDATIREMKKTPTQSIGSPLGQMEFDLASMEKFSKAHSDFESRLVEAMNRNETRLTSIICQFNPLVQQVAVLRKKEFWYKQILDIKCSNLRKAEAEVDILGDEVDTLLSVLGKIYIALDHYAPVLKHYPGVIEILMLVQKVLKGESI
ncbi:hypothetical protein U9M48_037427 [Paspalum notatum var. saurae]|uniref:WPP domain-associated protein n=1 Tax=Paspalum notatum var. saurae TaxID=547442 RepID=A0AAQ3UEZ3_PASNO